MDIQDAVHTGNGRVVYSTDPTPTNKDLELVYRLLCKVLKEDRTLIIQKKHNGGAGFWMKLTEL